MAEYQYGRRVHTGLLAIMNVVLLPSRIAGWGILIWVVIEYGFLHTIGIAVVAFLISMIMQFTVGPALWGMLGTVAPVVFIAAIPIMVIVIIVVLATN